MFDIQQEPLSVTNKQTRVDDETSVKSDGRDYQSDRAVERAKQNAVRCTNQHQRVYGGQRSKEHLRNTLGDYEGLQTENEEEDDCVDGSLGQHEGVHVEQRNSGQSTVQCPVQHFTRFLLFVVNSGEQTGVHRHENRGQHHGDYEVVPHKVYDEVHLEEGCDGECGYGYTADQEQVNC